MSKHPASPYDMLHEQLALRAHEIAPRHGELDALGKTLKSFNQDDSHTREQRWGKKSTILEMLRAFDVLTPSSLEDMLATGRELTDKPLAGEITALVEELEATQQRYRSEADPAKQKALRRQSEMQVRHLGDTINARRELVQPKRPPRIDPTRSRVLKGIIAPDVEYYSTFVRAFADSVEADRSREGGEWDLQKLPHIHQVADEAVMFKAMLDLVDGLDSIIKQCTSHGNGRLYWQNNSTQLKKMLGGTKETFNEKIRELHPRITAGYRGLATTRTYDEYVKAEKAIDAFMATERPSYDMLLNARDILKHNALELLLGGTNEDRSEPHHNFLTRVGIAYREDRRIIRGEAKEHERKHVRLVDRCNISTDPYNNPLTSHSLHTLNRVYEARWAVAADRLSDIVGRTPVSGRGQHSGEGRYTKTLADPEIALESSARPPRAIAARVHVSRSSRRAEITKIEELLGIKGGRDGGGGRGA